MATKKVENREVDSKDQLIKELAARLAVLENKEKEEEKAENKIIEEKVNKSSIKSCLLPGKKVSIVPINKGGTNFISDPEQATMLRGTAKTIRLPINRQTRNLVDPLTKEEKDFLEEVLGLNLNIHSRDNDGYLDSFYATKNAVIKLKKEGFKLESATITLDLGDPFKYLLYKIALANPRVAKKWADRFDPRYEFVIKDEGAELAEELVHIEKEDLVLDYLRDIRKNRKALYDLIRLYGATQTRGLKVSKDSPIEWLYNELKKVTKTVKGVRDLYNIVSLHDNSPNKISDMILVQDAIECGILERRGLEIKLRGGEVIGHGTDDAINYLNTLENKNVKLRVSQEVEKYLKNK